MQKDGGVYITGEEATIKAGRRKLNIKCSAKSQDSGVVVVGGGSGGLGAIEGLRAGGYSGKITVISSEPHLPIDRTKLSKALITDLSKIEWRSSDFFKEGDVDFVTGQSVGSLSRLLAIRPPRWRELECRRAPTKSSSSIYRRNVRSRVRRSR